MTVHFNEITVTKFTNFVFYIGFRLINFLAGRILIYPTYNNLVAQLF